LLTELAGVISMSVNLKDTISANTFQAMVFVNDKILCHTPEEIRNSISLQEEIVESCDITLSSL
jgi:hypothetical protein